MLVLNYQNLKYSDIRNSINYLIENKCFQEGLLAPLQQIQLNSKFNESAFIKPFLDSFKLEEPETKVKVSRKVEEIFNRAPNELDYDTVKSVIQQLV